MKMKEVCARTGLSERAVRLYCEEGLLAPEREEVRGRVYLHFDDHNIRELEQIAVLRGAGLSLEEIRTVRCEPHLIGQVLAGLRGRLTQETAEQKKVLAQLDAMAEGGTPGSMAELVDALSPRRPYCNGAVLREGEQSFRTFCESGWRGEPQGYTSLDANIDRGRVMMRIYGAVYWLLTGLSTLISIASYGVFVSLIVLGGMILIWVYLLRGAVWARVLHVLGNAVNCFVAAVMAMESWPKTERMIYHTLTENNVWTETEKMVRSGSWWLVGAALLLMLFRGGAVYFLGFSRWGRDYFYDRSVGR